MDEVAGHQLLIGEGQDALHVGLSGLRQTIGTLDPIDLREQTAWAKNHVVKNAWYGIVSGSIWVYHIILRDAHQVCLENWRMRHNL